MRIRIMALSGALAASTLLAAPVMADTTTTPAPINDQQPVVAPAPAQVKAPLRFRNSCRPRIATLPSTVEGQPAAFVPGAAKGLYLWHERAGWRVRLTHPQTRNAQNRPNLIEVRGRITSTRPLTNVRTIQLEDKQRGEWVAVQRPSRKVLDFRFVNGGFIDGINFAAGCSGRLGFTVWEVTKDAVTGAVVRTPMPIYVGTTPTLVTASTIPALAASPADVSRVVILRSPVTPVTPVTPAP